MLIFALDMFLLINYFSWLISSYFCIGEYKTSHKLAIMHWKLSPSKEWYFSCDNYKARLPISPLIICKKLSLCITFFFLWNQDKCACFTRDSAWARFLGRVIWAHLPPLCIPSCIGGVMYCLACQAYNWWMPWRQPQYSEHYAASQAICSLACETSK